MGGIGGNNRVCKRFYIIFPMLYDICEDKALSN